MTRKRPAAKKPVDTQKQVEKRARREERKLAEARAKQLAIRNRRTRIGLSVLIGVVAIGTIGFLIVDKATLSELPGVTKADFEGRSHALSGQPVGYATAAPTSGVHAANSPRCGIYSQQLPLEFAIHSLEHGGVVIWYQPSLASEEISSLTTMVNRFDDRVILAPNDALTQPVVATAWTRFKAYDSADPEIEQFIETYRNRGPESFRCAY